eukprot:6146186-Alexandrium_andersonii.AAC.1
MQFKDDDTVTNRQRRRIARQRVMAMYAGLVMGLQHLDDATKTEVAQVTQEWYRSWEKQHEDPENPRHFPALH